MSSLANIAKRLIAPLLSEKSKRYIKTEFFQVPDIESSLLRMKRLGFNPAVAIDVGAYIGEWTRSFKRVFPMARVLMVEPQTGKTPALSRVASELPDVEL